MLITLGQGLPILVESFITLLSAAMVPLLVVPSLLQKMTRTPSPQLSLQITSRYVTLKKYSLKRTSKTTYNNIQNELHWMFFIARKQHLDRSMPIDYHIQVQEWGGYEIPISSNL